MQQAAASQTQPAPSLLIGQEHSLFLTFTIGNEEYGVDIMMVREVKGWSEVTRLPGMPDYMRGVLNLRGIIIPIFDLRARFGGTLTQADHKHVVIILSVGLRTIGILVDAVSDILTVGADDIKTAPDAQTGIDERYVSGLIAVDERMVVALDIEKLLSHDILALESREA